MCGIIGYVGPRTAKELLLQGLERLEYRGYDSAGICLIEERGLTAQGPPMPGLNGALGLVPWYELDGDAEKD